MSPRVNGLFIVLFIAGISGCGGPVDPPPREDGGARRDSGPGRDGGPRADGSVELDAGAEVDDGGVVATRDAAGGAPDGAAPDGGGAMPDGGAVTTGEYQGFGAEATGGSESATLYHVTNLDSSGPGSLADGIGSDRTIVFDVGGTIYETRLDLIGISYLTIDGTTAPAPGITLDNRTDRGGDGPGGDVISFDGDTTHHCILRGVRTINGGNDGINVVDGAHDIMIANCSSYDNADGNIDVAGGDHVTIQYCILGPSSTGGPGPMLITASNVTVHHNFFSPRAPETPGERCPMVHCNYSPVGSPNADISNNLIWRFGRDDGAGSGFGVDVAYAAAANVENNYTYTEGSTPENGVTRSAYGEPVGALHATGNISGNAGTDINAESNHAAFPIPPRFQVTTQATCEAAELILTTAGPRPLVGRDMILLADVTSLPGCR